MSKRIKKLPLDKIHEIEVEKVFEAMITIQNLRIQSGIFFGTVNLGALGIAFTTQKAGLIVLASLLLWAFIWIDFRGRAALAAMYYRALQLKNKYAPEDDDSFLNILNTGSMELRLREIEKIPDRAKRIKSVRQYPMRHGGYSGFWIPLLASLIEIFSGLILWSIFKWSLF
jgi:hypothetical protein